MVFSDISFLAFVPVGALSRKGSSFSGKAVAPGENLLDDRVILSCLLFLLYFKNSLGSLHYLSACFKDMSSKHIC